MTWLGYGQTGPYAKAAGYDVIIEGEAGLMHMLVLTILILPVLTIMVVHTEPESLIDHPQRSVSQLRISLQVCTPMAPSWRHSSLVKRRAKEYGLIVICLKAKLVFLVVYDLLRS